MLQDVARYAGALKELGRESDEILVCVFCFSSRRRHTRFDCDWSSDVCSSDLSRTRASQTSASAGPAASRSWPRAPSPSSDRKSTRLNSSHSQISYAVFCLKKKKKTKAVNQTRTEQSQLHRTHTQNHQYEAIRQ